MNLLRHVLVRRWLVLALMVPLLGACKSRQSDTSGSVQPVSQLNGELVHLALTGYNYTNHYISRFSVNGQGGGNLYVSSPSSGGGGTACCVGWTIGATNRTAKIRWQVDSCFYDERTGSDGEIFYDTFHFFKEVVVPINPNIPRNPRFMEVHFYPDGHVAAAVTEESSPPRLKLDKTREIKRPRKPCPDNKRPVGEGDL